MLEIKTVKNWLDSSDDFDKEVNAALAEGWELTRRDIIIPQTANKYTMLYAELERYTAESEEEEPEDDGLARWVFSRRNPLEPYHCSFCGHPADPSKALPSLCPNCQRRMELMTMRGLD